MSFLKKTIKDSINAKRSLYLIESKINLAILHIYKKLRKKGKIFLCGNGGSASDAQHLATEFLIRLKPHINRPPIAALSLANDVSTLTACGNDFSFEKIFSRNLDALASSKDILLVISTSGNSKNIIEVLKMAKKKKFLVLASLENPEEKLSNYVIYLCVLNLMLLLGYKKLIYYLVIISLNVLKIKF